jgi:long-chain acyl-CoA synthetase
MVVGDMLLRNANKFPQKIAIVSQNLSMNYQLLNERVNRLANALIKKGLRKGDRIGILVHNGYQFIEIYFAAAKTGGVFCPYNNHLKERELTEIINYSNPRLLILDEDFADIVQSIKGHLGSLESYICLQKPGSPFMLDYEALVSKGEKKEPGVKIRNEDIMSIFFTAGTTGKPKGAMRTHGHVVSNATTGVIELKVSYDERALISFPMYHVAGEDNIGRHFFMPNTVFIRREGQFDPEEVLELLSTGKITICQFVPTMMNALLQFRDIDKYDLSNLRLIIYTGSPMPVELLKRSLQKFKCEFVQLYGQTEGGPSITILYPEDHILEGSIQQLQKLGSAGRPVISYEVRIVNDQGKDVPVGEIGEIIGRSEAVMKRYWRLPKETAKKLKDGWLHTGDLGKFDEGGYLYIVDRKGDMIISGGVNIYPREVEEILYQHPSVLEASVIGVPDDYWGEAVKAIIVLKEGAESSGEEIISSVASPSPVIKSQNQWSSGRICPKAPKGKS